MRVLREFLPARYAPVQANGNGIQSVYLTELQPAFAKALAGIIGGKRTVSSAAWPSARRCKRTTTSTCGSTRLNSKLKPTFFRQSSRSGRLSRRGLPASRECSCPIAPTHRNDSAAAATGVPPPPKHGLCSTTLPSPSIAATSPCSP